MEKGRGKGNWKLWKGKEKGRGRYERKSVQKGDAEVERERTMMEREGGRRSGGGKGKGKRWWRGKVERTKVKDGGEERGKSKGKV